MQNKTKIKFLVVGLLGLTLIGCESTEKEDQASILKSESQKTETELYAILDDLTPELQGLTERPVDADVQIARTFNVNWRQFYEDWGKVFLLDRPSRLNKRPIP